MNVHSGITTSTAVAAGRLAKPTAFFDHHGGSDPHDDDDFDKDIATLQSDTDDDTSSLMSLINTSSSMSSSYSNRHFVQARHKSVTKWGGGKINTIHGALTLQGRLEEFVWDLEKTVITNWKGIQSTTDIALDMIEEQVFLSADTLCHDFSDQLDSMDKDADTVLATIQKTIENNVDHLLDQKRWNRDPQKVLSTMDCATDCLVDTIETSMETNTSHLSYDTSYVYPEDFNSSLSITLATIEEELVPVARTELCVCGTETMGLIADFANDLLADPTLDEDCDDTVEDGGVANPKTTSKGCTGVVVGDAVSNEFGLGGKVTNSGCVRRQKPNAFNLWKNMKPRVVRCRRAPIVVLSQRKKSSSDCKKKSKVVEQKKKVGYEVKDFNIGNQQEFPPKLDRSVTRSWHPTFPATIMKRNEGVVPRARSFDCGRFSRTARGGYGLLSDEMPLI
jgi:hypothetical protein